MTQKKAKFLINFGKIFITILFVIFFVVIVIQSIKINNLKSKKNNLETSLENKLVLKQNLENRINEIESNFDDYSEEELRKDNYKKENEDFFVS